MDILFNEYEKAAVKIFEDHPELSVITIVDGKNHDNKLVIKREDLEARKKFAELSLFEDLWEGCLNG